MTISRGEGAGRKKRKKMDKSTIYLVFRPGFFSSMGDIMDYAKITEWFMLGTFISRGGRDEVHQFLTDFVKFEKTFSDLISPHTSCLFNVIYQSFSPLASSSTIL